jgi:hypothetical protein
VPAQPPEHSDDARCYHTHIEGSTAVPECWSKTFLSLLVRSRVRPDPCACQRVLSCCRTRLPCVACPTKWCSRCTMNRSHETSGLDGGSVAASTKADTSDRQTSAHSVNCGACHGRRMRVYLRPCKLTAGPICEVDVPRGLTQTVCMYAIQCSHRCTVVSYRFQP